MNKKITFYALIGLTGLSYIFLFDVYKVMTPSMASIINSNDYVLVVRKTIFSRFKSSDILSFNNDMEDDHTTYIKRSVAVEGDTIRIERDYIMINDFIIPHDPIFEMMVLERNYGDSIKYFDSSEYARYLFRKINNINDHYILNDGKALIVPENYYFMVGDNYYESMDSRFWGFIPKKNIKGKVIWIF